VGDAQALDMRAAVEARVGMAMQIDHDVHIILDGRQS
jgi:hypothetical protein